MYPLVMWVMWVMPIGSHGLRYLCASACVDVGHVGYANRIAWFALTMRPCAASKMQRLCAVGHVGTQNSVFKSLYPIL